MITLPEIETAIAKLEKTWREVGGSIDYTVQNVDPDIVSAFVQKRGGRLTTQVVPRKRSWCSFSKSGSVFGDTFTVTLMSKINKKAPVGAGA